MGRHFEVVEDDCTGCKLCEERAPENLKIASGTATARVIKQPETPEEEQACVEASEYCPLGGLRETPTVETPPDSTADPQPSPTRAGEAPLPALSPQD